MFVKAWSSSLFFLALSLEVNAHAAISPVLGLSGEPSRRDVKIPTLIRPCGLGVNVASALGQSTPVQAAADGTFTATITNFNPGRDGSRQVTARVDAAATGKNANFVDMTVSQNGDAAPPDNGSQQIVASLPAGTKCTGGTSGDLCLVSFKTLGRFGNCIAVQQTGGASDAGSDTADTGTSGGTDDGADADAGTSTGAGVNTAVAGKTGTAGKAGTAAKTSAVEKTGSTGKTSTAGSTGSVGKTSKSAKTGAGQTATGTGTSGRTGVGKATSGKVAATQANQANARLSSGKGRVNQGGTRAARALLAELEGRGEELSNQVRRGVIDVIWA